MKSLLLRAAPLALCLALIQPASAQLPSSALQAPALHLTAEQWREDLRFMAAEMKRRHANLYHKISRERFDREVADLDARIPSLQRNEIIVGMMRLAALIGDGHTRVEPRKDKAFKFRSLPLQMYLFDDGLFVRSTAPDQRELLGAKVEAVGGVPVAEAIRRVSQLASAENAMGPRLYAPIYLGMPDVLQAVGLASTRDAAELTLSKGQRRWTQRVPVGDVPAIWPPDTDASFINPDGWFDARKTRAQPLWLEAPLDYHRIVELKDQKAIYAQLNWVTDLETQSLSQYADRIFALAQKQNPEAVILDLRLNFGGDGNIRNHLVNRLLKLEDDDTRLFVLTGRGSFSATQFLLSDLDRLSDAVFVGEPASSSPSGYGDAYRSVMPNSGITVRTSIKYWQDGQDFRPWTPVDVAAPLTFSAYAEGRDPALGAALAYRPRASIVQLALAASRAKQDPVQTAVRWAADPVNRYADQEGAIIEAAVTLLNAEEKQGALLLGRWVASRFPKNTDAASIHAHAAEAAGQPHEARSAAEESIRRDANNRFARALLERLSQATSGTR